MNLALLIPSFAGSTHTAVLGRVMLAQSASLSVVTPWEISAGLEASHVPPLLTAPTYVSNRDCVSDPDVGLQLPTGQLHVDVYRHFLFNRPKLYLLTFHPLEPVPLHLSSFW